MTAVPQVTAVTYADYAPLWATDGAYANTTPEGFLPRGPEDIRVHHTSVAPGYFDLLKTPLLQGRDFTLADDAAAPPVMIVNQAFATRYFGNATAIGRRVQVRSKWHTIVGVVKDSRYFSFTDAPQPHFYRPFRQAYRTGQQLIFFVRTNGDPESAIASLRANAAAVDSTASGFLAATLWDYNALLLLPMKLATNLLTVLGAIAFLLAGVGLHGVISYTVSQRTRELGIRMALGAGANQLLALVLKQGLLLSGGGILLGLLLSAATMRLIANLLTGVTPFDPITFLAASAFLLAVTALATYLPARRATRIEPLRALHNE